ncbi:multidrug MFS transporter [Candidatus Roizmanbacteria bacterium CG_4_10_14_0_8_um_filter_39_9]|uniref:Multidrug MFS transporter n=1 Tax=Candidatus Roizmanbacteria bacterium CG_4_10_14_0_8_um_filter_39_9 TaxID=1974829 RepID=A0A2M7QBM7_9BACT|nr:MAG: multidrug MFS transporter [Candidatus Roizmanbacteria bacterium CG_4_10_14_0_8_um_filter_39_9]
MLRLLLYRIIALIGLLLCLPFLIVCLIIIKLDSPGAFLFKQKRLGKDRKPFVLYKMRTMIVGAEQMKSQLKRQNEADGPVFKIRNDPRYTQPGKFLSHSGLDEIPQLINVLRGEMSLVGPRPLPLSEAKYVPDRYNLRFSVLPGMTSPWIIKGAHTLTFKQWMRLDVAYVKKSSIAQDFVILGKTLLMVGRGVIHI